MVSDAAARTAGRIEAPLALDEHLCFALYGASMAIGRLYKPVLDEWGITYPQYLVLAALWDEDRQPIGLVAERLGLEPSTVTPMARRLAAAGYVVRDRNPADERQVVLALTPVGAALRDDSHCLADRLLAATGMPVNEIRRVNGAVKALRDAVGTARATPEDR